MLEKHQKFSCLSLILNVFVWQIKVWQVVSYLGKLNLGVKLTGILKLPFSCYLQISNKGITNCDCAIYHI